jgi:putative tricarboxylic transport membrane protein
LHHPGPGFFPFFGGMVLATFSAIVFVRSVLVKSRTVDRKAQGEKENHLSLVYTVVGLIVYALILEYAGYMLSTLLLVVFLLRLFAHKEWWVGLVTAAVISSASYTLFAVFLKSELPIGIFEGIIESCF